MVRLLCTCILFITVGRDALIEVLNKLTKYNVVCNSVALSKDIESQIYPSRRNPVESHDILQMRV